MVSRKKPNSTLDPRKVSSLKEKARREANMSTPDSSNNINNVLYGPHTENGNALGAGEYNV